MPHHVLKASVENCQWGFFDAKRAPVLTIKSGDTVTIDTVSGQPFLKPKPDEGYIIPPELNEIHAKATERGPGPHILTGPVAVEGAKPGHVLEIRVKEIKLRQDWAYNAILPLMGALPDDFNEPRLLIIRLDMERKIGKAALGGRSPARAVLRRHGRRAAARTGAASRRSCRARWAAIWTTRIWARAHALSAGVQRRRDCFHAVTGMRRRDMARSA